MKYVMTSIQSIKYKYKVLKIYIHNLNFTIFQDRENNILEIKTKLKFCATTGHQKRQGRF